MNNLFYFTFLLFGVFIASCNQEPDLEDRFSKTNLSFPKNYRQLNFKSEWGVGETTEDYILVISREDYLIISKEIEDNRNFQYIDTCIVPIQLQLNDNNMNEKQEAACRFNNKYFYQIFRPDIGVVVTVLLEKDSLMNVSYNDL